MGSQSSKGEVSAEAAADASTVKTNGQENGHVKTNGDVALKPDEEAAATNGPTEAAWGPETGAGGDAIEPAPPAVKEADGLEGEAAAKATPKKKKKFSLKKTFKLKLNLKKSKKSEGIKEEAAVSPSEEKPAEDRAEEEKESKKEDKAAPTVKTPEAEQGAVKEETPKEEVAASPEKPAEENGTTPSPPEKKE